MLFYCFLYHKTLNGDTWSLGSPLPLCKKTECSLCYYMQTLLSHIIFTDSIDFPDVSTKKYINVLYYYCRMFFLEGCFFFKIQCWMLFFVVQVEIMFLIFVCSLSYCSPPLCIFLLYIARRIKWHKIW